MARITYSLVVVMTLDLLFGVFKYYGPVMSHLDYFVFNYTIKKIPTIGFIMVGFQNIINFILPYASVNLKIKACVEEIFAYVGKSSIVLKK